MIYSRINLFSAIVVFLFCGITCRGQVTIPSGELQNAYENFDATIGLQNTGIFTGVEYIEKHRMVNEKHKFFGLNEFIPTTVIYKGQPYYDIPAKYNIFDDLLLVNLSGQRGETNFKLIQTRLDGFMLDSRRFINIYEAGSEFSGIYELLFDSPSMQLLKKYRQSFKKVSNRALVHYEFKPRTPDYYFRYHGNFYNLSRKNLLELFPNHKEEVREQYRKYRKQQKERRDEALVAMFRKLSEFSNDVAQ